MYWCKDNIGWHHADPMFVFHVLVYAQLSSTFAAWIPIKSQVDIFS